MNKYSKILVSIIISTYNDEQYIEEAVDSILNQSHQNIEVIVINDASTDGTLKKLEKYGDKIILLNNKINQKLAHNLNKGILLSHGKYIARMDADDISLKNRIAKQVKYMETHPEIDICGSYACTFGASSTVLKYPLENEKIKCALLFENALCHPTVMFRKSSIDFLYDESLSASQDYELWSRVVWNKKISNIPEIFLKYRIHSKQTRFVNGGKQKAGAIMARKNMLNKFGKEVVSFEDDFLDLCSLGKIRSKDDLKRIEDILKKIVQINERNKIYDTVYIKEMAAKFYYLNWMYSLDSEDVDYQTMKNSSFSFIIRELSLKEKLRLRLYHLKKYLKFGNNNV